MWRCSLLISKFFVVLKSSINCCHSAARSTHISNGAAHKEIRYFLRNKQCFTFRSPTLIKIQEYDLWKAQICSD